MIALIEEHGGGSCLGAGEQYNSASIHGIVFTRRADVTKRRARTTKGASVKRLVLIASLGAALLTTPSRAEDTGPAVERFRAAYEAGHGLSYVVIPEEKGERVYRYGDASREAAKKDKRGFMLFTCASPHVFDTDRISHRVALAKAKVVHAGDPEFAELDTRYLEGCKNPFVKSAVPQGK
jgi:hypothetical protein